MENEYCQQSSAEVSETASMKVAGTMSHLTTNDSAPLEDDAELVERNKARLRRRLRCRWACNALDHNYCYTKPGYLHVPLSEEDIEIWVSGLHDGEVTTSIPPKTVLSSNQHLDHLDTSSITSAISRGTDQHPSSLQSRGTTNSVDSQSIHTSFRESVMSSRATTWSITTASSGVPGIGYLSGKGIKWVGNQMLDGIGLFVVRRRRRAIRRFIERMMELPVEKRAMWLINSANKIIPILKDLLRLSLECDDEQDWAMITEQGVLIKDLIEASVKGRDWNTTVNVMSINVRVFPLFLYASEGFASRDFASELRETLLLDSSEPEDEESLAAEIAVQLCRELAYGNSSPWRWQGYAHLWYLYGSPAVRRRFHKLARQNKPVIKEFMKRIFDNPMDNETEHAYALVFSSALADDVPAFRSHLSAPTGIQLLVENINVKVSDNGIPSYVVWTLCQIMGHLALLPWCISTLAQLDVCPTLVRLLIINQCDIGHDKAHAKSWAAFCIIRTLYNMGVEGGDHGKQNVVDSVTDELLHILPDVGNSIRKPLGDAAARATETWIQTIQDIC